MINVTDDGKCPFKIGQHVKFDPPYKGFHDLNLWFERTGLSPRIIYEIKNIQLTGELVCNEGLPTEWNVFKNAELDYKLGRIDNSWAEERARYLSKQKNFFNKKK